MGARICVVAAAGSDHSGSDHSVSDHPLRLHPSAHQLHPKLEKNRQKTINNISVQLLQSISMSSIILKVVVSLTPVFPL